MFRGRRVRLKLDRFKSLPSGLATRLTPEKPMFSVILAARGDSPRPVRQRPRRRGSPARASRNGPIASSETPQQPHNGKEPSLSKHPLRPSTDQERTRTF